MMITDLCHETMDGIIRAHLTPKIDFSIDQIQSRRVYMVRSRWCPTQKAKPITVMLDVLPKTVTTAKTKWVEMAHECCVGFDRWLEFVQRDADLWRALQERRRNRWWRRLWRAIH